MLSAPSGTMNIPGILQKAASFGTGDTFNNIPETFFTGSSESQFAVSQERASGSTSSDGESMIAKVTIPTLSAIQPGEAGAVLMADFVKLYQEAEASGVLSDPQLKQIVEGAALGSRPCFTGGLRLRDILLKRHHLYRTICGSERD